MNDFIAKNPKQLDICLRLLYAEKCEFNVSIFETASGKIVYTVTAMTSEEKKSKLLERYRMLIS